MLLRTYAVFMGILFVIVAILGYSVPALLRGEPDMRWMPTVWLLTGLLGLAVGLLTRRLTGLRWFTGIVGILYTRFGIIALINGVTPPRNPVMEVLGVLMLVLGVVGITALLASLWKYEREEYVSQTI